MANDYYTASGAPATSAQGASSTMRGEYALIAAGFDKLPSLAGNADLPLFVNAGATALTAVTAASARTKLGVAIGSNVQAFDADLSALAALGATGIAVRTAADTWAQRQVTQPAAGITVTNPAGVAGDITLVLANDLLALEALAATGIAVRTGADAWAQRTIAAGSSKIVVTNPGGVAGNPTVDVSTAMGVAAIAYVFDGGGAALTTGVKGDLLIPFDCTINSVTLEADQSGSIVIDIWKKTYTLDAPPTVANTITAAALPTLTAHQSSQDATLTGWTTAIAANDMLRFNINSITTCTRVTLTLKVTKS